MIDIVFSFDTTGSMSACIGEVRRKIKEVSNVLFENVPDLRIGLIAHGDYEHDRPPITIFEPTNDHKTLLDNINKAPNTNGSWFEECYELVLEKARHMAWRDNAQKILVLIGDTTPHRKGEKINGFVVTDWRANLKALIKDNITVYPIQALGRAQATDFYDEVAETCGTVRLNLPQFSDIVGILLAVTTKQIDPKLEQFERIIKELKLKYTAALDEAIAKLTGKAPKKRKVSEHSLAAVHPSRFQLLDVDDDTPIKNFVQDNGLKFKIGRGFYEFTKKVTVQDYKEIVLRDKETGDMFSGDKAREIVGIPLGRTAKVSPTVFTKYDAFIQSTSPNRKLLGGTRFLYELEDYEC